MTRQSKGNPAQKLYLFSLKMQVMQLNINTKNVIRDATIQSTSKGK